jgi:hypothetical protein
MKKLFIVLVTFFLSTNVFADSNCTNSEITKRKTIAVATTIGAAAATGFVIGVGIAAIPVATVTLVTGTVGASFIPATLTIGAGTAVFTGSIGILASIPIAFADVTCVKGNDIDWAYNS